jgi:hypothetical protein
MEEARQRWFDLGRPLDAARCLTLRGRLMADSDPEGARDLLDAAASEYEELGAPALAARAREAVPS